MAKISAHGKIIGTVETLKHALRYMSDGYILRNQGFGWKLHKKVKPGVTPEQAYAASVARQSEYLALHPAYAAYRTELHAMTGTCNRWKLHAAVSMMPDDADGVWSEACDGYGDNCHADVDDVAKLCRLYKNAVAEKHGAESVAA